MKLITRRTSAVPTPKHLKPGIYHSVVTWAGSDPRYVPGTAFRVDYILTDGDGNTYDYSEVFYEESNNQRTNDLWEYLDKCDRYSEEYEHLIGFEEELELMYEVKRGKRYLNIYSRHPASSVTG